MTVAVLFFSE